MADQWVDTWRVQLSGQGRRLVGGWPGTVPEALALVRVHLARTIGSARLAALGAQDVDRLARLAYARARQQWLANAERELPESGARSSDGLEPGQVRRRVN
jgi:hypothetical protein